MTFRCSDAARERDDPAIGTAPPQRRWLLVEHQGPWPVSAPYDAGISRHLLERLGHPELRVVLIRRYGRHPVPDPPSWALAEPGRPLIWGHWREPRHLLDAVETEPRGEPRDGPVLLVCTHGVHDVCCAVRGRPVAQALAARWPAATWECSHLGGDRFAANVMVFPDGTCYGGLDEATAPEVIAAHVAGTLVTGSLRGIAGLRPAEQAAVSAVHERYGPAPAGAARPTGLQETATGWRVEIAGTAPLPARCAVEVSPRRRAPHRLTCRVERERTATAYEATDLRVLEDTPTAV